MSTAILNVHDFSFQTRNKDLLPVELLQGVLVCKQHRACQMHNKKLPNVYFAPIRQPRKGSQAGLRPEITAAMVLVHEDQSNTIFLTMI
jgi:hypothetical protein